MSAIPFDAFITCDECGRVFDMANDDDAVEWHFGHDCEVDEDNGDPFLHCDFCATVEWAGDLTTDWNGETGNHISCEVREGKHWPVDHEYGE